jgi:glyoxylase I family protein
MEKVTGVGGLFLRAHHPVALAAWYRERLGVTPVPSDYEQLGCRQEAGPTAIAPFPEATDYFGDSKRVWIVNLPVRDLDAMMAQLRGAGIRVELDPPTNPNGHFVRLHDPEANPIELRQPAGRDGPQNLVRNL